MTRAKKQILKTIWHDNNNIHFSTFEVKKYAKMDGEKKFFKLFNF